MFVVCAVCVLMCAAFLRSINCTCVHEVRLLMIMHVCDGLTQRCPNRQESLSRAQLETKKTQVDLHRVAKGFADLKVNSSLLEVQLEQSRDTMEKMVQQKAAVDVSYLERVAKILQKYLLFRKAGSR